MKRINLIPAPRIDAKRRRNHARQCMMACGAYATIVLFVAAVCRLSWGDGIAAAQEKLAGADAVIEHTSITLAKAKAELAAAKTTLATNRQLSGQPDWSLLLALLAGENGDSVVLKSCALNTREEVPAPPTVLPVIQTFSATGKSIKSAPVVKPPRLAIAGTGDSQLAVTQFVVRLEKTGLFRRVTMLDTTRETFLGSDAIGFRLECILNEGEK